MKLRSAALAPLLALSFAGCSAPQPAPSPPAVAQVAPPAAPLSAGTGVAPAGLARRSQHIDLDVEDVDLAEVCDRIGRQVGRSILVDPAVHERVTISLHDVSWRDALDIIARMTRCEIEERPEGGLHLGTS